MTVKVDLMALLGTLPSVSGVASPLWYSVLLKNVLMSLRDMGLGIVTFFNDLFFPPLLGHLVQSLRFAVFASAVSAFIPAFRKACSANDVLIRFIENWKQSQHNHKYVGMAKPIVY